MSNKYPMGKAPSCGVDEYIGSDFDVVKSVADNLEVIKDAASLVGPEATSLFTSILEKLGHNIVGSFEKGATISGPQNYITYQDKVYHYNGGVYPYVVSPNSQPNSDFSLGYRGSVEDWDAFDKALLDWANEPITGEPDTVDASKRLNALKKLGVSQYWKPGETINQIDTLVRFNNLEYQVTNIPATMGISPIGDPNFRRWTVTPDDVVPGIVAEVTRLRDEAQAAAVIATNQAVSSVGSSNLAKDSANAAKTSENNAKTSELNTAASEAIATNAANAAVAAKNTVVVAEVVVSDARDEVVAAKADIDTKYTDIKSKHADVVAKAITVNSQMIQSAESALNAKQSADEAKAAEQRVANNASTAQQAEVSATNSANLASVSATNAQKSATESANAANIASTAATTARTSSTDAANAATEAVNAATEAKNSIADVGQSTADALRYSQYAASSAQEAQTAAVEGRTYSTQATESAKAASTSATNADNAYRSTLGIADQVLPAVSEVQDYAAAAKADAQAASASEVVATQKASQAGDYATFVTGKASEALTSANTATQAKVEAVAARDETVTIYNSIKSGVTVKGSWDASSNAYPTDKSTNARWDVVVSSGVSHDFDGKTWRNGDVLYYSKDDDTFYHTPVQGVGGVTSVNGKAGDVVLVPSDIGALSSTGTSVNSLKLEGKSVADIVADAKAGTASTADLTSGLNTKLGKTEQAADSLKLEGKTKAQVITEAKTGMASVGDSYTKGESDTKYPVKADVVDVTTSQSISGTKTFNTGVVVAGVEDNTNAYKYVPASGDGFAVFRTSNRDPFIGYYNTTLNKWDVYLRPQANGTISYVHSGGSSSVYHSGNKPSPGELGAVDKTGDVMSGSLRFSSGTIYFGAASDATNQALSGSATHTYVGTTAKSTVLYGSGDLKFGAETVFHTGNPPTAAQVGAVSTTGKAADSTRLDGKTKTEVIAEARTGLLTSDQVYTKIQSDERYPTKVSADASYAAKSHTHTWADIGGDSYITTSGPYYRVGGSKWLQAGSTSTGFLPYNSATGSNAVSYIGTSSWWFKEAWVNSYRGGSLNITGDIGAGSITLVGNSASFRGLSIENATANWSWLALKSGTNEAHIAQNAVAADGGVANSLHLRPLGQKNGSLIIQPNSVMTHQTSSGYINIGCLSTSYAHFQTDRPQYHFNKAVYVSGEIYAGANYNQRVYHTAFKPTPADIGALSTGGNVTVNATGTGAGQGLAFNGKTVVGSTSDGWLRLNPHGQFSTGIYCAQSIFRTDGDAFQCKPWGSNGATRMGSYSDTGWGTQGSAAFMLNKSNTNGAHWILASTHVNGTIRSGIQVLTSDTGNMRFYTNNRGNYVEFAGGGVYAQSNVSAYSDKRVKDNIENIPDALAKVQKLNGVTYTRTDLEDTEKRHVGLIAQEVEAVIPEAVSTVENGNIKDFKTVAYGNMVALLIEAVKEQQSQIEQLKQEIESLKVGK